MHFHFEVIIADFQCNACLPDETLVLFVLVFSRCFMYSAYLSRPYMSFKKAICVHTCHTENILRKHNSPRRLHVYFYVSTWFLQIPVFFYIAMATCSIEPFHM